MRSPAEIQSGDAVRALKVDPVTFRHAIDTRLYPAPPSRGRKRRWDLNDLISLCWFSALTKAGLTRPTAGRWAGALLEALECEPEMDVLTLFVWEEDQIWRVGTGVVPDEAQIVCVVPVAALREHVKAAMASYRRPKKAWRSNRG